MTSGYGDAFLVLEQGSLSQLMERCMKDEASVKENLFEAKGLGAGMEDKDSKHTPRTRLEKFKTKIISMCSHGLVKVQI